MKSSDKKSAKSSERKAVKSSEVKTVKIAQDKVTKMPIDSKKKEKEKKVAKTKGKKDKSDKEAEEKPSDALTTTAASTEDAALTAPEDPNPAATTTTTTATAAASSSSSSSSTKGTTVIYLGGIPYGFFEHEIKGYLSQFGAVSRLRLSRSKRTGASRHFAFVEFAEPGVADVVARTMDGYLLAGNMLRCRAVAPAALHPDTWKGANRRFKPVPWARLEAGRLRRPEPAARWDRRASKEDRRRAARAERLREIGYEFDGPALKKAEALEPAEPAPAIEAAPEE